MDYHHSDLFFQWLVPHKYKLAVYYIIWLNQNDFTDKDSFNFIDEILTQDSDFYMASLEFDHLFTNIPLDETIDICLKTIFQNPKILVKGISKNDFCDLLNFVPLESFLTFNNKLYIR